MDVREASAMTEASGLMNERGIEQAARDGRPPIQPPPHERARRWADRLRKLTVKAPLTSLFTAFLLGAWVARRR